MGFASAANLQDDRVAAGVSCAAFLDEAFCQFECQIAARLGPIARLDHRGRGLFGMV